MYTARVSQTAPHAYRSLWDAVTDDRLPRSEDLYIHIDPGHYEEARNIPILRRVLIVPVQGPGSVEISVPGNGELFSVQHTLELYGLLIRSGADFPVVSSWDQGRVKAVDCVFDTAVPLRLWGEQDEDEVVNCRFEGGGLTWHKGGGQVRDCHFERSVLLIGNGADAVVSSVEFTGYVEAGDPSPTLSIHRATASVTGCVMTDAGVIGSQMVINVSGKAEARFTDLSFTSRRTIALCVVGEGTRAEFSGLRIDGAPDGVCPVLVHQGEITLSGGWIGNAQGTAVRLSAGAKATLDDLTVEDMSRGAFFLQDSALTGRNLVFRRLGGKAVDATDSQLTLSDVEIRGHFSGDPSEDDTLSSGLEVTRGSLEVDGLRVSGLTSLAAVVMDCKATMTGVALERTSSGIAAGESSMVRVRGMECSETEGNMLLVWPGAFMEVTDAKLSGSKDGDIAHSQGGGLTLRSVTVSGAGPVGVGVREAGALTLEDTVIQGSGAFGLRVVDAESRATVVRSRITGNGEAGVRAHPDAVVEMRDVILRDNGDEDGVHNQEEQTE